MMDASNPSQPVLPGHPAGPALVPPSRTIGEMRSPLLQQMHQYWLAKSAGRLMPARADLAPDEIKKLLPHLILVDIEQAPFRLYYRLVGTAVQARNRRNATGHYLDQLGFATEPEITATYRHVAEGQEPHFGRANLASRLNDPVIFEYGIWPLSDDGITVNKCLAMEAYLGLSQRAVLRNILPVAGSTNI